MRPQLEVLICTIGAEGIARVAASVHPRIAGVGYLVCWQQPDGPLPLPPELASREDFRIVTAPGERGISRNRNRAIGSASADWCLMGDDDINYSESGLTELLHLVKSNPAADIITLRYTREKRFIKPYPETPVSLNDVPKGYYVTAFEIAFRRESIAGRVRFNEKISLGTPVLRCGEEDVFIHDARKAGLNLCFHPVTIGAHDHPTTAERDGREDYFVMTHGAVIGYIHPRTKWLRLTVHAWRERAEWPFFRYLKLCAKGIRYARKEKIFSD